MDANKKICCLVSYGEIPADKQDYLRRELEREVMAALEDGYRFFATNFAQDADILFIGAVNRQRDSYPAIFLEVVLPFLEKRGQLGQDRIALLSRCNGIKPLCGDCQQDYPLSVTRYLIMQASRVIAVYGGQTDHDTAYSVDYARATERDLRVIKI